MTVRSIVARALLVIALVAGVASISSATAQAATPEKWRHCKSLFHAYSNYLLLYDNATEFGDRLDAWVAYTDVGDEIVASGC